MNAQALADLGRLYARVDAEVAGLGPRCEASGRCCLFERSGQRLLATDLEAAYAREAASGVVPHARSGRCPWLSDGLCGLRAGRPLGCRLYFCDPTWSEDMTRLYERFHAELCALHEQHGLAYRYGPFVRRVRWPARRATRAAP